jgi:hypothetical protein
LSTGGGIFSIRAKSIFSLRDEAEERYNFTWDRRTSGIEDGSGGQIFVMLDFRTVAHVGDREGERREMCWPWVRSMFRSTDSLSQWQGKGLSDHDLHHEE